MFVGSYEHSLDDKGRIVLPAKFRERLATGGFVTIGSGGCLVVWTQEDYEAEAEDMKAAVKRGERSRDELRAMAANSSEVKPDSQGRVALPSNLRTYAGITGAVTVVGVIDCIELWDTAVWRSRNEAGSAKLADA